MIDLHTGADAAARYGFRTGTLKLAQQAGNRDIETEIWRLLGSLAADKGNSVGGTSPPRTQLFTS